MAGQVRSFAAGGQTQDLRPCGQDAADAIGAMKRLMDERLSLMTEVARQKWNTKGAIEDLLREKEIVDGLKVEAAELGLSEVWAERFFRAQIEAGKVIQRECFVNWGQAGVDQFGNALDLARVIRPRLDQINSQLLRVLVLGWPVLADPTQCSHVAATTESLLAVHGELVATLAVVALREVETS
ncbi:Periplasmic chorismate mutase I precursor [Georgfuchsia toluolica]|uniref:chorismate mutase n=1 Tax=Georgfuchsia toluolica TaxID=424218 RepID=A0A916N7M2_9PROT|nr:gamma subclass chorismate mutase AroQ [Georgfuchsia toluolica]CAG4882308.1 Periplasmic chorismate mutase I precursor [Georgfuchsia toluolica]